MEGGEYRVKKVDFFNRTVPIMMQNENGPCPLLALANVLLLRNQISLPLSTTSVKHDRLISLIAGQMLDTNREERLPAEHVASLRQNMEDAILHLPKLTTGVDVNPRFHEIGGFEFTRDIAIFDLLGIRLVHGWLADPQDTMTTAAISGFSYNELVSQLTMLPGIESPSFRPRTSFPVSEPKASPSVDHRPSPWENAQGAEIQQQKQASVAGRDGGGNIPDSDLADSFQELSLRGSSESNQLQQALQMSLQQPATAQPSPAQNPAQALHGHAPEGHQVRTPTAPQTPEVAPPDLLRPEAQKQQTPMSEGSWMPPTEDLDSPAMVSSAKRVQESLARFNSHGRSAGDTGVNKGKRQEADELEQALRLSQLEPGPPVQPPGGPVQAGSRPHALPGRRTEEEQQLQTALRLSRQEDDQDLARALAESLSDVAHQAAPGRFQGQLHAAGAQPAAQPGAARSELQLRDRVEAPAVSPVYSQRDTFAPTGRSSGDGTQLSSLSEAASRLSPLSTPGEPPRPLRASDESAVSPLSPLSSQGNNDIALGIPMTQHGVEQGFPSRSQADPEAASSSRASQHGQDAALRVLSQQSETGPSRSSPDPGTAAGIPTGPSAQGQDQARPQIFDSKALAKGKMPAYLMQSAPQPAEPPPQEEQQAAVVRPPRPETDSFRRSEETAKELQRASIIQHFFHRYSSQLTEFGLLKLHEGLRSNELCILFRNNHFTTLFAHKGSLWMLITDQGYLFEKGIVWEKLSDVGGNNEFVGADFSSFQAHTPGSAAFDPSQLPAGTTGAEADMALALQLQEEENRRQEDFMKSQRNHAAYEQATAQNQASRPQNRQEQDSHADQLQGPHNQQPKKGRKATNLEKAQARKGGKKEGKVCSIM